MDKKITRVGAHRWIECLACSKTRSPELKIQWALSIVGGISDILLELDVIRHMLEVRMDFEGVLIDVHSPIH